MESTRDCPECRTQTISMNRNHLVKNLCDTYLGMNPDQRRPKEELDHLDSVNKIREEAMNHPHTCGSRGGFQNMGNLFGAGGGNFIALDES